MSITSQFQSTLPVWGGTVGWRWSRKRLQFQSTLPVWGGTGRVRPGDCGAWVSIHPPRVGRDPHFWPLAPRRARFQSTLPVWGGTHERAGDTAQAEVSIHPPRVGRDPGLFLMVNVRNRFQSTLPVWGGTAAAAEHPRNSRCFNPPSPCGEGLCAGPVADSEREVSIHPPRVGRDLYPRRAAQLF